MSYQQFFGAEPGAVATPTTVAEVEEALRWAAQSGQMVIPWGGGTGQTYGYLPRRDGNPITGADWLLLDLSRLNRVISHEPGDLTLTVEAGVTLAATQEVLSHHDQYLPLDPPHPTRATIGGILATDAFGASVLSQGRARDWLIGLTVIDAQGRLIKGGGKVVKNVTGYDLPKLHIGALGTLGVMVEATFKVAPRPESTEILVLSEVSPTALRRLHRETLPAMSLLRETGAGRALTLLYAGFAEVTVSQAQRARTIGAEEGSEETGLPPGMPAPFTGSLPESELIARVAGRPSHVASRHQALAGMELWSQLDTYPGTGQTDVYLKPDKEPATAWPYLVEWGLRNAATITALHAPLALRQDPARVGLWSPVPPTLALMQRLKSTLDPKRLLNPGRFLAGI